MTPIQQLYLGVGASEKTYIDDVFSSYVYKGNSGSHTIANGIDNSKGGLLWTKARTVGESHTLFDTARASNKAIYTNLSERDETRNFNLSFLSNGFSWNTSDGMVNSSSHSYAAWNFRKAPGFFDVVTWTGNGSARTISHSLGCIPGVILVKRTDSADRWQMYHHSLGVDKRLYMNLDWAATSNSSAWWNATLPTSSVFSIGTDDGVNANNGEYVAYLFAGGESDAATARSVDFDGTNDYLSIADHADFDVGTNWTAECWFKCDQIMGNGWDAIFGQWSGGYVLEYVGTDLRFYYPASYKSLGDVPLGQWHHFAVSKEGSNTRIFLNGTQVVANFDMGTTSSSNAFHIGGNVAGGGWFNGKISNVRIVQGTAVYTSSFRPPTEPLTNITNTKLLCCNDSSQTGSTVTPGTITNNGSTASTDSPFDDPAGFVFGESGSESVIKCGSYKGNGSSTGPEIFLGDGWEPQFILMKNAEKSENWLMWDSMRGIVTGGNDARLFPNLSTTESSPGDFIDLTSTGFKIKDNGGDLNESGDTIIYLCIRRPDGYCGKLSELGTDVFAMDTGNSNADQAFTSGFPVDFAFNRQPATASQYQWEVGARLMQGKLLYTWKTDAEISYSDGKFDDNTGWLPNNGYTSNWQSWMWKRHAGFDVVAENNLPLGANIPHSLGKTPEMIIAKNRNNTFVWGVYHKGVNGGTNPEQYRLRLNTDDAQQQVTEAWNNTAPTTTHFTVGVNHTGNSGGADYKPIFFLFSSVAGISSVGSYTGNGDGSSGINVTTGFQPRFYMIKRSDAGSSPWYVVDSLRGMSNSGDEKGLQLENSQAQFDYNFGNTSSTGFTITATHASLNANGGKYIYYAHA